MNVFDVLIIQPIFNVLIFIYSVLPGGDFGIALILFTVLVRWALWPLLKKQLHQVKAMRKMQPELKKIKVKAKGNKQAEGLMMMELYKKHNISPFRSIGILIIQLPIFIAIYQVVQILTLHRDRVAELTYPILHNIGPIKQLIADPNQFNERLFGFVDLTKHPIGPDGFSIVLIVLVLISAFTQYIMSRQISPTTGKAKRIRDVLAEASNGKEPDQAELNAAMMSKMNKFMPIFMFFVMLNLPGALSLYYTVSNLMAVLQQRHILKQDEEELEKEATTPSKKKHILSSLILSKTKRKPAKSTKSPKQASATTTKRVKNAKEATVIHLSAKDTPTKAKGKS